VATPEGCQAGLSATRYGRQHRARRPNDMMRPSWPDLHTVARVRLDLDIRRQFAKGGCNQWQPGDRAGLAATTMA